MGVIHNNDKIYLLLYGPKGSGKSQLLYSQMSTIKLFNPIEPTKGINYEEIKIQNKSIGIFEVPGDLMQNYLINVVTSNVDIKGIIYVIDINDLKNANIQLKLLLSDKDLEENMKLFVIYNLRAQDREKYSWINIENLDEIIGLKKIEKLYKLKYYSTIYDCSTINEEVRDEQSLEYKMSDYMNSLFAENQ